MEQANEILRDFLKQQRVRAGLSIESVAKRINQTIGQLQAWEDRPINAPLNRIAELIGVYKTSPEEFYENIWNVERALRGR